MKHTDRGNAPERQGQTMSKASELKERVLSRMDERKISYVRDFLYLRIDGKYVRVHETARSNGTEENVTVTVEGMIKISEYSSRRVLKVRIPKNASDKVIDKRLDEVEKWLKG